jgi:hypothetical protein
MVTCASVSWIQAAARTRAHALTHSPDAFRVANLVIHHAAIRLHLLGWATALRRRQ